MMSGGVWVHLLARRWAVGNCTVYMYGTGKCIIINYVFVCVCSLAQEGSTYQDSKPMFKHITSSPSFSAKQSARSMHYATYMIIIDMKIFKAKLLVAVAVAVAVLAWGRLARCPAARIHPWCLDRLANFGRFAGSRMWIDGKGWCYQLVWRLVAKLM